MMCSVTTCPATNCIMPERQAGRCCPVCPEDGCLVDGHQYTEGERFDNPSDPCQECLCVGGRTDCRAKACHQTRCNHPVFIPGQCCPQCTGKKLG